MFDMRTCTKCTHWFGSGYRTNIEGKTAYICDDCWDELEEEFYKSERSDDFDEYVDEVLLECMNKK